MYNLSNEKIGKELNISKEKIRKILMNVDKRSVPFDNLWSKKGVPISNKGEDK